MKKRNYLIGIGLLVLAALACNSLVPNTANPTPFYIITEEESVPTQTSPQLISEADVPRIDVERALVAFTAGEATFVDVRSVQAYDASHVAGAVSIPLTNIDSEVNNLPLDKDRWIITYCT
jgi:hypothetical protein